MTSEHTWDPVLEFFKKHNYFGLNSTNIIFEQNTLPTLNFSGKIVLSEKHLILRAPDGNGGLYDAMIDSKNQILEV